MNGEGEGCEGVGTSEWMGYLSVIELIGVGSAISKEEGTEAAV